MSASRIGFSFGSTFASSFLVGATLCVTVFSGGCSKSGGAAKEDLALVPKETEVVVGVNFARMRGTALWKKALDFGMSQEKNKKDFEAFSKNCVDVTSADGPESLFIALPEPSQATKDGAFIIRLKTAVDDAKVQKCFEYLSDKNGEKVVSTDYNGKKILTSSRDTAEKGGFCLLDGKTIAFGTGVWIKKIIDLSTGKDPASAKQNEALVALVKRAKTSDAMWGVGTVPAQIRDNFKSTPQLAPFASLKAIVGSMDFASGLAIDVNMDTLADADAKAINEQVTTQLAEVKKSPQVQVLGVGGLLDAIKTEAKGPTFHVAMRYNQQQVDEMVTRVQGMFKSFGAGLVGGAAPSAPGAPPEPATP